MGKRVVQTEVRVRYCETDSMRVAWHGNYIVWFELARTEWLRVQGLSYKELEEGGVYLPVLRVECDYKQTASYDDELIVETRLLWYNGLRMAFAYTVKRPRDEAVLTTGVTEHAFTNHQMRPVRPARGLPVVHALLLANCEESSSHEDEELS